MFRTKFLFYMRACISKWYLVSGKFYQNNNTFCCCFIYSFLLHCLSGNIPTHISAFVLYIICVCVPQNNNREFEPRTSDVRQHSRALH